jgi:hypothetical protein
VLGKGIGNYGIWILKIIKLKNSIQLIKKLIQFFHIMPKLKMIMEKCMNQLGESEWDVPQKDRAELRHG